MEKKEDEEVRPAEEPKERGKDWVAEIFGDVGEFPGNDVEVDRNAEKAPNHDHPA